MHGYGDTVGSNFKSWDAKAGMQKKPLRCGVVNAVSSIKLVWRDGTCSNRRIVGCERSGDVLRDGAAVGGGVILYARGSVIDCKPK